MRRERKIGLTLALAAVISLSVSGCGGSDSDDSNTQSPDTKQVIDIKQVSGLAIDGYLSKAKVCIDVNNNSTCDAGEPTATTDETGKFDISTTLTNLSEYNVLVEAVPGVTVDSDNNSTTIQKAFFLKANASEPEVVSPITTLIQNNLELNASLTKVDVIAQIKKDLNVSENIDITGDYIANKVGADTIVYEKIHTVARVVTKAIATTLESDGNVTEANFNASTKIMLDDIATKIETITFEVEKDDFNEDSYDVSVTVDETKVTELEKKIEDEANTQEPEVDNRVMKVVQELYTGNWSMEKNYTYNSEGLLIKKVEQELGEGGFTYEDQYTYDAHGNLIKTTALFSMEDEPTPVGESITKNTYSEVGTLIKVETEEKTTIYNDDKTIAKEITNDRNTTYHYTNGLLTSKFATFTDFTLYYPSGTRFLSIINGDKPEYLTMLTEYEYEGTKLKTLKAYEYNEGNATLKEIYETQTYSYNENGDVTLVSIDAGTLGSELIHLTAHNYDAATNKLTRVLESAKSWKYNDANERVPYYDIKDTQFTYDENLNVIEKAISYYERENEVDGEVQREETTTYIWDYIN